ESGARGAARPRFRSASGGSSPAREELRVQDYMKLDAEETLPLFLSTTSSVEGYDKILRYDLEKLLLRLANSARRPPSPAGRRKKRMRWRWRTRRRSRRGCEDWRGRGITERMNAVVLIRKVDGNADGY
ncbi:unnamed protein product, partial [Prorocentrum cordatum]